MVVADARDEALFCRLTNITVSVGDFTNEGILVFCFTPLCRRGVKIVL